MNALFSRLLLPAALLCGLGGSLWLLPTAAAQAPAPAGAGAGGFKDLQVLPKTISKADLKAVMKLQSKALGVDCDFCHKSPNMEADTDHKKVAREMMQMVNDINKKYPTTMKKVSCWTCHRGRGEPEKQPK